MITNQLKAWVAEEARNIKRYATAEEIANINLKHVDPDLGFTSVYTELTGSFVSNRAKELLKLCAVVSITHFTSKIKECKNGQTFKRGRLGFNQNLSAIEYFLLQTHFSKKAVRRPLIDFLTGTTTDIYN